MNRNLVSALLLGCTSALLAISAVAADDSVPSEPVASAQPPKGQPQESASTAAEKKVSLADVLEGSSGVRVATMCTNCNVANVTMNGQTGDRVQVWQDGLPVVGGLASVYLLSVMPPEGIASTEILRGAGTVLSGAEAAVGAVVLRTRNPQLQKEPFLSLSADVGSYDWLGQKIIGSGRKGRFGGLFAVTHARSNGSDPNDDGVYDLGRFERITYGGTGTVEIYKNSYLRVDALGYSEDQNENKGAFNAVQGFSQEDVTIRRHQESVTGVFALPDGSRLNVLGRYSKRDQDTSDNARPHELYQLPYMKVEEKARHGQLLYERTIANRHLLTAGFAMSVRDVFGTIANKGADGTMTDVIRYRSAFAQMEFALPKRFDLTLGVLYTDHGMSGDQTFGGYPPSYDRKKVRFLPRLRLAWKASRVVSLSLSAGEAVVPAPSPFDRVCCGQIPVPNTNVLPETSWNYLLDLDLVPARWVKIRGSVFRHDYEDYVQKMAIFGRQDSPVSPFHPVMGIVNYSDFTLYGGEISTEFRFFEKLSFGFEASHLRVRDRDPIDAFVFDERQTFPWFSLPQGTLANLPKDQASAFLKWEHPAWGLDLSAQAQYTGPMTIQVLKDQADFGLLQIVNKFETTPSFWIYNFGVKKRIGDHFAIFGGVDNIGDAYQDDLEKWQYEIYNWGPLRGRYFYAGVSWQN